MYIQAGASHVVVTSYVFYEGKIDYQRLEKMVNAVGKEKLVLDLSCRKKDDDYYVVTDRWQNIMFFNDSSQLLGLAQDLEYR